MSKPSRVVLHVVMPDTLHHQFKIHAAHEGRSMTAILIDHIAALTGVQPASKRATNPS